MWRWSPAFRRLGLASSSRVVSDCVSLKMQEGVAFLGTFGQHSHTDTPTHRRTNTPRYLTSQHHSSTISNFSIFSGLQYAARYCAYRRMFSHHRERILFPASHGIFFFLIHIPVLRTSSLLCFASFSSAACNASPSPNLLSFLSLLLSSPLSSSVLAVPPVYRLSPSHITTQSVPSVPPVYRLSHSHITTQSVPAVPPVYRLSPSHITTQSVPAVPPVYSHHPVTSQPNPLQ
jgi:hypothetical protein